MAVPAAVVDVVNGPRVWMALIRLRTRQKAAERLVEARLAKTEQHRRQAFHGPPMTPEEVRQHEQAVAAQRQRDEARRHHGA